MRVLEQLIGIRRRWIVLGASLVGLVFPAGAMASLTRDHIITGAVSKAQGFKLSLDLLQGGGTGGYGGRNAPALDLYLNRTTGSATQVNDYEFMSGKICGSKSKCAKDDPTLSYALVKATFSKKRGSIHMTFHPKGSKYKVNVPKGCGRSGYSRHGTLSGKLVLKADKLGTVKLSSIKATLSTAIRSTPCPQTGTLLFGSHGLNKSVGMFAWQVKGSGNIREELYSLTSGQSSSLIHCYSVTVANSGGPYYTHTSDLSGATVNGTAGITGSASWSGTAATKTHPSNGTLSGNLQAKTAAVGMLSPFAQGPMSTPNAFQQTGKIVPLTRNPFC